MNNAYITITSNEDSVTITPSSFHIGYESLAGDDSGRTDDGTMHISWKLRKIPILEITLPPHSISDSKYNKVLSYVQGQTYKINYFDYIAGERKTIDVYTSSSSFDWYSGIILNGIVTGESFTARGMTGESNIPHH